MKSTEDRLKEVMPALQSIFEFGIDLNHPSILHFKKIANEFVQGAHASSGTLQLKDYDRNLVWKLSNKVPSIIKLEYIKK